ncbi:MULTISPECIES: hypothetical protein [Cyanophyceae]|nr:hypothetical protein [Trichocoleus sp. FACHB-69]MBD1931954.1 hypothetical protein [Trichocoleus sp. FACHB-69]
MWRIPRVSDHRSVAVLVSIYSIPQKSDRNPQSAIAISYSWLRSHK